ncbi:MAG: hypothetical protein ABWY78_06195 [Microvirga sp.]
MPQGIAVAGPPDVGAEPAGLAGLVNKLFGGPGGPLEPGGDPYKDKARLLKQYKDFSEECFDQRWVYERSWWRNLLYILGRQWIFYDTDRGNWRDKRMAKWVPRPVTNKISETVDAIASVFQSVILAVQCRPDGGDPKDVTTAETCNKLSPAIHYEHEWDRIFRTGDFWLIGTGNVFYHPWWDKRGTRGPITIPLEKCQSCGEVYDPATIQQAGGICPGCGQPSLTPAMDETGQPQEQTFTMGRGATDVCSPFEIAFPMSYASFPEIPGLIRKRWRSKAWAKQNLPKEIYDEIQWEQMSTDRSLQMLRGLAMQNEVSNSPVTTQGVGSEAGLEGYTEYEQWMKPSKDYPDGLLLRVAGEGETGKILELPEESVPGPLPFKTQQGAPLFPWVHVPYTEYGGRIWARSPLDALIQKQDQINQIDSLTQLIIQRVANPVWLEPKGTEVKKFTGEPGLVVKYNPLALGGNTAKPERLEGSNVPSSLFNIREQLLSDIENLAGTYDIIKGQKPTGVEAFSALQLLVERSQSRYAMVLAARGEAYRLLFEMAIELEREFGPMERTWAVLGPNQRWTFEEFKNANLQGAIRVVVEDGSQTPKTSLGKRAAIQQLMELQVINPQNPETAYEILKVFGQTDLWPGLDYDVKSALQEQDDWERWAAEVEQTMGMAPVMDPATGQPQIDATGVEVHAMQPQLTLPPVGERKPWHNDMVHLAEHKKWANGDAVRQILQLKPWLEQYVGWMIQSHEQMMMVQQAQQSMIAAGPGGAGPPGGAGRAMKNSNQESGNPADVPSGAKETPTGQGPA